MKKIIYMLATSLLFACSGGGDKAEQTVSETENAVEAKEPVQAFFGEEITVTDALPASQILAQLEGKDSVKTKLIGTVDKVCQVKGCWMTMNVTDDQGMHVSFKDYGFFVPKNIDGKEAVIEGYAYMETMSVDDLKHYAEDAGKSEEEIAQITEPETKLSFVAEGVIVKDYEIAQSSGTAPAEESHH